MSTNSTTKGGGKITPKFGRKVFSLRNYLKYLYRQKLYSCRWAGLVQSSDITKLKDLLEFRAIEKIYIHVICRQTGILHLFYITISQDLLKFGARAY